MTTLLIKYGELTTKKGNRAFFIKTLKNNIVNHLKDLDYEIKSNHSYMTIVTSQDTAVIKKLKNIFGIHAIIKVSHSNDYEACKEAVIKYVQNCAGKTFKVKAKRSDKSFVMTSMETNCDVATAILKNSDLKVDVHNPDILVQLEIREDGFYSYEEYVPGLGGYPLGIQGKGVLLLSGGIDSPVAAFLAMKRGIKILPLYFDAPPHTTDMAREKVEQLVEILSAYDPDIKLNIIHFTKIQEAIYKYCRNDYMITIMRRMMFRIAEWFAVRKKAKVLITGESIGQVASQTLDSINVINYVVNIPIIRPLACFDKLEIIALAREIGTYKTSILPYEDCCTVFVPKHPVINPILKICEEEETKYDFASLIKEIF